MKAITVEPHKPADPSWLAGLITRREPPAEFMRALQRQPDDIKVVVQFAEE